MTEPPPPSNATLIHALVALAARCAERDPRPTVRAARAIADEVAAEYALSGGERDALQAAAEALAAPLVEPREDDDSYNHDSLFTPAVELYPRPAVEHEHQASATAEDCRKTVPTRTRRTLVRKVALFAMIIAATVVVITVVTTFRRSEGACEAAIHDIDDLGRQLTVCQREYADTGLPKTGARIARLLVEGEKRREATALATRLLGTSVHSDALQILGTIHVREGRLEAGRASLELARVLHVVERRPREIAIDDQALARIFWAERRFVDALRALDACIAGSRQADDRVLEGRCYVSSGEVFGELGFLEAAQEQFARSQTLLVRTRDLARLEFRRGALEQRYGFGPTRISHNRQAVAQLERAIGLAIIGSLLDVRREAELKLVYSLAELGRTNEAAQHLVIARQLDLDGTDANEHTLLEARIAYRRDDLARATALNDSVYDKLSDDERMHVCILQAQIGLATGDLGAAELWAERAINLAEPMYAAWPSLELGPRMRLLAYERLLAHELLFSALARAHRVEDSLIALDGWQAAALLEAIAQTEPSWPSNLHDAAMQTEALHRLFPELSSVPLMRPVSRDELLAGLRNVDLVAMVVADEEVWRINARRGSLGIVNLGSLASFQPLFDLFTAAPTRTEVGDLLGARLLGDQSFRETRETLFIVLAGKLSKLPVVALRAQSLSLVAMRPIVRVSRLSELDCVPARPSARDAVIIADAHGDLPQARREAFEVAASLGVSPKLGSGATRAVLFAAMTADVLHVAVHANVGFGGGTLDLSDESVSALDILAAPRSAPRLVVLSADPSFATAFLASGSSQVIATLRPVTDAGASEVARAFYREGGIIDPVRTLARVQAELAGTANTDWPNFALFGHDICRNASL